MKIKKYKTLYWFGITFFIVILYFTSLGYNKTLKGYHLLQNIIGDGQYTLHITPAETDLYTFQVDNLKKNAIYEVYNTEVKSIF